MFQKFKKTLRNHGSADLSVESAQLKGLRPDARRPEHYGKLKKEQYDLMLMMMELCWSKKETVSRRSSTQLQEIRRSILIFCKRFCRPILAPSREKPELALFGVSPAHTRY